MFFLGVPMNKHLSPLILCFFTHMIAHQHTSPEASLLHLISSAMRRSIGLVGQPESGVYEGSLVVDFVSKKDCLQQCSYSLIRGEYIRVYCLH